MRKRSIAVVLFLCALGYIPACTLVTNPTATPAITSTQLIVTNPASATLSATATHTPTPTRTPTPTATFTPSPTPVPPQVVIISVDGLRPDAVLQVEAPNLLALAERGAYTWQAETAAPVTLPGHVSMLTGLNPGAHGVTWNDYLPEKGYVTVPTIFTLAHAAGLHTAMIVGKEKFAHLNVPGTVDHYAFVTTGDRGVVDAAIAQAAAGFDLLFVHLPNIDYYGHSTGWMSTTYLAEVTGTDAEIGRLLEALPPNATVLVTADHGGHDRLHGVASMPEDVLVPWIIAGPGVAADHALRVAVRGTDTAATAAYVLGLRLPPEADGRPVLEAFGRPAPDLLTGAWSEGARQAPARSELPAAVLDGRIYLPGGFDAVTAFQSYDPAADAWRDLAPLPAGRHHMAAAALDGRVYAFGGGSPEGGKPQANTWIYDPAADAWTEGAALPEPRLAGAAVALNGRLYVVGGAGGTAALLEYDPARDRWRSLAPLAQPREHLAAAVLDGEIYALGGRWQGTGELASVEIYNPRTNTWRAGAAMLQARAGFAGGVLNGRLLVAGGEILAASPRALASMEVFDPRTNAWAAATPLPAAIHGVAGATVGWAFYLLGGSSQPGAVANPGQVWVYSP